MDGELGWSCPSNIAIIKYWGKKPVQIPMNPSLSMTLHKARTFTRLGFSFNPQHKRDGLHFRFEGKEAPAFEQRINQFLKVVEPHIPVLAHTSLEIESRNSFPHSSGIASSASAMGALAMCLVQMEEAIAGPVNRTSLYQKASFIARLGSGSASRSIYPRFAIWGRSDSIEGSSDEFAIPYSGFHPDFMNTRDAILIVESGQKKVSSSQGHALMDSNPFSSVRFNQAFENLAILKSSLADGDWDSFISLMEEEALTLHAMMMTGRPGYLLMQPGTLSILQKIREFRKETRYRLGFTLDAGANVHLLYADEDAGPVEQFISSDLKDFCEKREVINDRMGEGPAKL